MASLLLRSKKASALQYTIDEFLRRAIFREAIAYVGDPAGDTNLRKADFCHVVTHGSGNPVKLRFVKPVLIPQAQDRYTIADAFIHQMFGAVAWWVRAVNITRLMMGTFMTVDKVLKFWRCCGVIRSENNRLALIVPDGHTRRHSGASIAAVEKANGFAFIVGAGRWRYDFIRCEWLCFLGQS